MAAFLVYTFIFLFIVMPLVLGPIMFIGRLIYLTTRKK
jgi:hypothetical protein